MAGLTQILKRYIFWVDKHISFFVCQFTIPVTRSFRNRHKISHNNKSKIWRQLSVTAKYVKIGNLKSWNFRVIAWKLNKLFEIRISRQFITHDNFRATTMGIGPIWGCSSLTLYPLLTTVHKGDVTRDNFSSNLQRNRWREHCEASCMMHVTRCNVSCNVEKSRSLVFFFWDMLGVLKSLSFTSTSYFEFKRLTGGRLLKCSRRYLSIRQMWSNPSRAFLVRFFF